MYKSPKESWNIAFQKHSPSTNIKHSPVISICGKLLPVFYKDSSTSTLVWVLTTTEEYYYQNCIEILSIYKNNKTKTNMILRTHRVRAYWPDRLINFHFLGSGCFGKVYKAEDKINNLEYALKQITTFEKKRKRFFKNIISIITEKSAHLRANESSFVVQMYGAFQDENLESFWLIFEFCIGDLSVYLESIKTNMYNVMDEFHRENGISEMYSVYLEQSDLDLETIGCIYSFELLAGLSYLAKRNLVHNDLKPENILLSRRGHLKIADLGLTQRVKWLDRQSSTEIVIPGEIKSLEDEDRNMHFVGNSMYTDPEALIHHELILKKKIIYKIISHEEFPITNGTQDFLTDLYGAAVIMMELLFAGLNFIFLEEITPKIACRFNVDVENDEDLDLFVIRCMYDKDVHENYLMKILQNQITETNESVLKFMMSCFKPKSYRALEYTKTIEHRKFKEIVKSRIIDIEKIENLDYYQNRNITEYNVCNLDIPSVLLTFYRREFEPPIANDFYELQYLLEKDDTSGAHEMKISAFTYVK